MSELLHKVGIGVREIHQEKEKIGKEVRISKSVYKVKVELYEYT